MNLIHLNGQQYNKSYYKQLMLLANSNKTHIKGYIEPVNITGT